MQERLVSPPRPAIAKLPVHSNTGRVAAGTLGGALAVWDGGHLLPSADGRWAAIMPFP